jgi:hypothetical protein
VQKPQRLPIFQPVLPPTATGSSSSARFAFSPVHLIRQRIKPLTSATRIMSNHPFSHESSELPDPNSSTRNSGLLPRRFSYAHAASLGAPFLNHPSRTSVVAQFLNPTDEPNSTHNWSSRSLDSDRNAAGEAAGGRHGTGPQARPSQECLSRAFDLFYYTSMNLPDSTARNMDILIPNYLRILPFGDTLAQQRDRLQEAAAADKSSSSPSRRLGPKQSQNKLLPSAWNKNDKWTTGIEVLRDELQVQYVGPTSKNDAETASIRSNQPIPPECGIYYYEVTILTNRKDEYVCISHLPTPSTCT